VTPLSRGSRLRAPFELGEETPGGPGDRRVRIRGERVREEGPCRVVIGELRADRSRLVEDAGVADTDLHRGVDLLARLGKALVVVERPCVRVEGQDGATPLDLIRRERQRLDWLPRMLEPVGDQLAVGIVDAVGLRQCFLLERREVG
jgi:hypothetical protein